MLDQKEIPFCNQQLTHAKVNFLFDAMRSKISVLFCALCQVTKICYLSLCSMEKKLPTYVKVHFSVILYVAKVIDRCLFSLIAL